MVTRVLWLVKGLGPGGAEHLLAAAAEVHDRGRFEIECAFVVPEKDHLAERLERAGVRCHCLSRRSGDPGWPKRLRELIASGEWDIVHAHSPLLATAGRAAVRSMPRPRRPALISTEHNEWSSFALPTRAANRLTSRLDDAVIAVSERTRRSMSPDTAARAVVVHHGIDVAAVVQQRDARHRVREELGLAADAFVIGTVANYRAQKDYPNLLRAMRTLVDRGVDARLVAVGQGPLAVEVESAVAELGLNDHVVLTGYRRDATRVMSSFDVFTLASFHEGLPVALMDAFALGVAVVATEVGGLADVLTDGHDALLVPARDPVALADAWGRLHDDRDLLDRLSASSTTRAGEFDIRRAVDRIESTYEELTKQTPTRRPAEVGPIAQRPPGRSRSTDREFTIRDATADDRAAILGLGRDALGWPADDRIDELFGWKHDRNAFGSSLAYVAVDDEQVIGFRVFMRWQFRRGDELFDAVRAVDTVTAPAWQGRGVFRALTMYGVDALQRDHVDFVFNTPNEASRPGYLALGWRDVGALPAAVRFSGPSGVFSAISSRVPADLWSAPSDIGVAFDDWIGAEAGRELDRKLEPAMGSEREREISTAWTAERLRWRFGGDLLGYRVIPGVTSGTGVVVRERKRGSSRELVLLLPIGLDADTADEFVGRAVRGTGVAHVLRLGDAAPRRGFVPMPGGGPMLTWRPLERSAPAPLANWALTMGDVELF